MEFTIILFTTVILLMIAEIIGFNIYCSKVVGYNITIKLAIDSLVTMIIAALVILITVIITKDYSTDFVACYTISFVAGLTSCASIITHY